VLAGGSAGIGKLKNGGICTGETFPGVPEGTIGATVGAEEEIGAGCEVGANEVDALEAVGALDIGCELAIGAGAGLGDTGVFDPVT